MLVSFAGILFVSVKHHFETETSFKPDKLVANVKFALEKNGVLQPKFSIISNEMSSSNQLLRREIKCSIENQIYQVSTSFDGTEVYSVTKVDISSMAGSTDTITGG
jgi:hypothetical protein